MTEEGLFEEKKYDKEDVYRNALRHLADDFNNNIITFKEHEKAKKNLHKDIFGY